MLSKVAERLYWAARYLERVENTARLLNAYDQLLYDLPREVNIGWYNLIDLNGSGDLFSSRYKVRNEHNVVKFILADDTNPSSMLSALGMVRENVRTTRDALPEDSWEMINEFYLFAKASIEEGIKRSKRHEFLTEIIANCQQVNGMLACTMRKDAGWMFIKLGQNLERADMTSRILDSGAAALVEANGEATINLQQIVWGHVLRSDNAYTAYRRAVKAAVSGPEVANFLLKDEYFPRSFMYCLDEISRAAEDLPSGEEFKLAADKRALKAIKLSEDGDLKLEFRQKLNDLQIRLIRLDIRIAETWFGRGEVH